MTHLARSVALVGVGYAELSRGRGRDSRVLTMQACRAAVADAGLMPNDVDGIATFRYLSQGGAESPSAVWVQRMLGIENLVGTFEVHSGPTGVAAVISAVTAVASGLCDTVLAYRTLPQREGTNSAVTPPLVTASGAAQFTVPYGYGVPILTSYALKKRQRLAELGGGVEDYGLIAINARRWAALNERALLRNPLTMDEYLASPTIVDPLLMFDCDYPIDGSAAIVVTTAERAADLASTPVLVDSVAGGSGPGADLVFGDDLLFGGSLACARALWRRSALVPSDIDVLALYDGFTHLPMSWIEALGLCGRGEFGDWADGGRTIGPGGTFPLNTSGGMLAEGRLQGIGHVAESVVQLRGEAGSRQVPGARVAVVCGGGSADCAAMLLRSG